MSVTRRKYNRYREKVTYEKPIFNKIKSDEQFYADLFEYWQVDINKPPGVTTPGIISRHVNKRPERTKHETV